MRTYARKRAFSWLLALAMLVGLIPILPTAAEAAGASSTGTGNGITVTQTASWDSSVPGDAAAKITLKLTSSMSLQTPKDVVFVIDHAFLQDLDYWKSQAKALAAQLDVVPGMRYALVAYASSVTQTLDFTEDLGELNAAIDRIERGVNCNGYAGLQAAKALIDGRSAPRQDACIVLCSDGTFNLNLSLTEALGASLNAAVPIYGIRSRKGTHPRMAAFCTDILEGDSLPMTIGESTTYTDVVISGGLGADFTSGSAKEGIISADGTFTYRLPAFQLGETLSLSFSGVMANRNKVGTLAAGREAAVTGSGGLSISAGEVSLERGGVSVTYKAEGAEGVVPRDSTLYVRGADVGVKSAVSLRKQGWNFSGWSRQAQNVIQPDGSFPIVADTELNAVWGRAFVKISSTPNASGNVHGSAMLPRKEIEKLDNKAFYNSAYWSKLASVYLVNSDTQIPASPAAGPWDITDTSIHGNDAGAVMAWVVKNPDDSSKYDLYIRGQDGLSAPVDSSKMFESCYATKISGLEDLDTSRVTDMSYMFFDTAFENPMNLSRWNTAKVTNMYGMFNGCQAESFNLKSWNTAKVTSMAWMFDCIAAETIDLSGWNVQSLTTAERMLSSNMSDSDNLREVNLNNWQFSTSTPVNMKGMFVHRSKLTTLHTDGWERANISDTSQMFQNCSALETLEIDHWNTANVTTMSCMFYNCDKLKNLNLNNWDTSKVEDMNLMFSYCGNGYRYPINTGIEAPILSINEWNTSSVTNMSGMFSNCPQLKTVNIGSWNTSAVKNMSNLFKYSENLQELDLSGWATQNVTSMESMFGGCNKLTSLDIGNWNTSRVWSMSEMFKDCSALKNLDISQWNTGRLTNTSWAFSGCKALESLDLGAWNMEKVTDARYMLAGCTSLTSFQPVKLTVGDHCQVERFQCDAGISTMSPPLHIQISTITKPDELLDTTPYTSTRSALPAMDQLSPPELEDAAEPEVQDPEVQEAPEFQKPEEPAEAEIPVEAEEPLETEMPTEEEEPTEAEASEPEDTVVPTEQPVLLQAEKTLYASYPNTTNQYGRPIYANQKAGLWDCGAAPEIIEYTLEVQYLNDENTDGGVSGLLTVTNRIPEGLIYNGADSGFVVDWIEPAQHIGFQCGGTPGPLTFEDGVLSFTVTGLSAGGKCAVTYTCTVPEHTDREWFLNTASVDNNGLLDEADPVLHHKEDAPEDDAPVVATYSYKYAPMGAKPPAPGIYPVGEDISLPEPVVYGSTFKGWKLDDSGSIITQHIMDGNAHFVGEWETPKPEKVRLAYTQTGEQPENAGIIWDSLMDGAVTELPENMDTSVPEVVSVKFSSGFTKR